MIIKNASFYKTSQINNHQLKHTSNFSQNQKHIFNTFKNSSSKKFSKIIITTSHSKLNPLTKSSHSITTKIYQYGNYPRGDTTSNTKFEKDTRQKTTPIDRGPSFEKYQFNNNNDDMNGNNLPPSKRPNNSNNGGLSDFNKALIAGAFILGIGFGVYFTTEVNFTPVNVASTEIIDRRTPSSEMCLENGFSSMVFDQRLFVSFNPFNVYVAQPEIKPGCILRRSNVNLLEKNKLVSKEEVETCKKSMNTFAFVGNLKNKPEISCVYHSEDAENQFLIDPKKAVMGDGHQDL